MLVSEVHTCPTGGSGNQRKNHSHPAGILLGLRLTKHGGMSRDEARRQIGVRQHSKDRRNQKANRDAKMSCNQTWCLRSLLKPV